MSSPSEGRRRRKVDPDRERSSPKDKDRDRERDRDKDKERDEKKVRTHRSSKSTRSSRSKSSSIISNGDGEGEAPKEHRPRTERTRTSSSTAHTPTKHRMAVVPEMERRSSLGLSALGSRNGSRSSIASYPTLSKTHAKENIYAREEAADRRKSPLTPEPTDVGDDGDERDKAERSAETNTAQNAVPNPKAPPSPPLTATTGADLRKTASANSMRRKNADAVHAETEAGRRSVDSTRLTNEPRHGVSRSSLRDDDVSEAHWTDLTSRTGSSHPSTVKQGDSNKKSSTKVASPARAQSGRTSHNAHRHSEDRPASPAPIRRNSRQGVGSTTESDGTTVPAREHVRTRRQREASPTNSEASPASVVDSSPLTPTQHSVLPSVVHPAHHPHPKERPPTVEIFSDPASRSHSVNPEYLPDTPAFSAPPPPPPPPPPPMIVLDAPRVDYLLLNGGLPHPVVRNPLAVINGGQAPAYNAYASPRPGATGELSQHNAQILFKPISNVLEAYNAVMNKNGSLAVATGYRSVARRLLDRLEAVFARNISSEFCTCIMCDGVPTGIKPGDDSAGVNWGEILELVSGRCDLPNWPPLELDTADALGITIDRDLATPCQKMDVDVPEEYRTHYARQSQKTKVAVQSWLLNQQDNAPEEADDETLTFAMLTRLEPEKRSLFHALICGYDYLPASDKVEIPTNGTAPVVIKAGLALQRLYRLSSTPRAQLTVMYLIRNPEMHSILATLAAVTKHEWEILVSGRFDGFLWSGAEPSMSSPLPTPGGRRASGSGAIPSSDFFSPDNSSTGPRRFASPGPVPPAPAPTAFTTSTPFGGIFTPYGSAASPRPGSTRPGTTGPAPVQVDEETEIAILAEVEREIHFSMDAMENAFEALHLRAEATRERLRQRAASLLMQAQARRGGAAVEVRMDTPANFADIDEALDDLRSDIGPDDSASNVSHNRRRGERHRKSRRTPAPVEEVPEEESAGPSLAQRIRRKL